MTSNEIFRDLRTQAINDIRESIKEDRFEEFKEAFIKKYKNDVKN